MRWKPILFTGLAAAGLVTAAVWLRRRKPTTAPPFVLDHLALPALLGSWYELARYGFDHEDRVGTRYRLASADAGSLRLEAHYHVQRLDAPEQRFEALLQRPPQAAPAGRLRLGRHAIWVLELSPTGDYLVAATPDRRGLWVLSRQPELAEPVWEQLRERLQAQGFDPERLIRTPQAVVPAE